MSRLSRARIRRNRHSFVYDDNAQPRYLSKEQIGSGAYGTVYKAIDVRNQQTVVIKQMKSIGKHKSGVHPTILREASLLHHLQEHPHIVRMTDLFWTMNRQFCIVFELCAMDLSQYIKKHKYKLAPQLIRRWSTSILDAIAYMHGRRLMHRDLKPQNVLITLDEEIKVGDLGLAKEHGLPIKHELTNEVVTLWYRAPEILLGAKLYSSKVDIWSCGCIIAEMARGKPLFQSQTEMELLTQILMTRGTPDMTQTNTTTAFLRQCDSKLPDFQGVQLSTMIGCLSKDQQAVDLLEKMLCLVPETRWNAKRLLDHPWLQTLSTPKSTGAVRKNNDKRQPIDWIWNNQESNSIPCLPKTGQLTPCVPLNINL